MLPKPSLILLDYDDTVITVRDDFERFALDRISGAFADSARDMRQYHEPVPYVELAPKLDSLIQYIDFSTTPEARPMLAAMTEDPANYNIKPGFSAFNAFIQSEKIPLVLASASVGEAAQKSMKHFRLAFEKSVFRDDPNYGSGEKPEMVSNYLRGRDVRIDGPVWVIGNGYPDLDAAKALARNEAAGQDVYMVAMGRVCQLARQQKYIHLDDTPNLKLVVVDDFDDLLKKTAPAASAAKPAASLPKP